MLRGFTGAEGTGNGKIKGEGAQPCRGTGGTGRGRAAARTRTRDGRSLDRDRRRVNRGRLPGPNIRHGRRGQEGGQRTRQGQRTRTGSGGRTRGPRSVTNRHTHQGRARGKCARIRGSVQVLSGNGRCPAGKAGAIGQVRTNRQDGQFRNSRQRPRTRHEVSDGQQHGLKNRNSTGNRCNNNVHHCRGGAVSNAGNRNRNGRDGTGRNHLVQHRHCRDDVVREPRHLARHRLQQTLTRSRNNRDSSNSGGRRNRGRSSWRCGRRRGCKAGKFTRRRGHRTGHPAHQRRSVRERIR